ncbi:uncharacterized protein LAESUDRAFT_759105 [Laetiporus sulphureus 93-53]|uniref:Uncharacterized protein n=1 Tax=Laetiporus sulphureus 93-53 TaxID=1314785 RepID=A0A165EAB9_9APHY|nr:uncharacterized protein LAESUDRAFT_759105 [Laetiporus sulphureus 93-53]KZT06584.1 hypothetical protein LAESUDRAFT_759105 [Laetiporus sulphureus 93-53]
MCNTAKIGQHDGGDEAISDNELFLDLEGTKIFADTEELGETLKTPADILADVTPLAAVMHGMSPSVREAFMKAFQVLTDMHTPSKEVHISLNEMHRGPKEVHTAIKEVIDASELDQGFKIPPVVLKLTSVQVHIPLMLVTSDTIQQMHLNPTSIQTRKLTMNSGSRFNIIDLTDWPKEESLPKLVDKEIIELFQTHYDHLVSLLHFCRDYKAILQFDCEVHCTWTP